MEGSKNNKQTVLEETEVDIYESFEDMNLKEKLRGIFAYGYEKPSSIQQKAIVPLTTIVT